MVSENEPVHAGFETKDLRYPNAGPQLLRRPEVDAQGNVRCVSGEPGGPGAIGSRGATGDAVVEHDLCASAGFQPDRSASSPRLRGAQAQAKVRERGRTRRS